jgi:uncharacterized surface protein with fasciclin (FAS1) repeats
MSTELHEGTEVLTLHGKTVKITEANVAKVNGAVIKKSDVRASNGIIHQIDSLLIPPA